MKNKRIQSSRHRKLFTWDYWYYYDQQEKLFHVFYLNADYSLVANEQHHFESKVGYAVTPDFTHMEWVKDDVLTADPHGWDNSSIWTGDIIKIGNGYLMFYTSRDLTEGDGKTQNIGLAFSENFTEWERVPGLRIKPDPQYYLTETAKNDDNIHAWRDPFLYRKSDNRAYMLVCAKANDMPPGRNGCIALLRSKPLNILEWEALAPVCKPGWYSAMEVPQVYADADGDEIFTYSMGAKYDHAPNTQKQGGFHILNITENKNNHVPHVLLPESSGIYACRVIPELDGQIIGFNIKDGGFVRSNHKVDFRTVNRDFGDFGVDTL